MDRLFQEIEGRRPASLTSNAESAFRVRVEVVDRLLHRQMSGIRRRNGQPRRELRPKHLSLQRFSLQ